MDLTGTLALGRFVRDGAALLLWGSSVYTDLLAPARLQPSLTMAVRRGTRIALAALAVAVVALLPLQIAALGEGWESAVDPDTIKALLFGTTIGTAWLVQGGAVAALLLTVGAGARWQRRLTVPLSAAMLASFTLTGHAAMHEGWLGVAHRANDLVHLLAAGFWFGALLPLVSTLAMLHDPAWHRDAIVALRRFSTIGHAAVALVIATGILNVVLILGRWPIDWTSAYEGLLAAKILLVVLMTALAILNRYAFAPRLRDTLTLTTRRIRQFSLAEVALGLGVIALVAIFGLLDPAGAAPVAEPSVSGQNEPWPAT